MINEKRKEVVSIAKEVEVLVQDTVKEIVIVIITITNLVDFID